MATSSLPRRRCPRCLQELSHSAYYRHLEDKQGLVCPGASSEVLSTGLHHTELSDSESSASLESTCADSDDTSFAFTDSETNCSEPNNTMGYPDSSENLSSDAMDVDDMLEESLHHQSSDEEIWESSSCDSDTASAPCLSNNVSSKQLVFGICFFLNFFQLFYRVSEKAILGLITFLKILFTFLGSISPANHPLKNLGLMLPKSLHSIRKMLKKDDDELLDYAVCPTCSTLYLMSDCIVQENSQLKSRLCEFVKYPNHPYLSRRGKCNTALLKCIKVGAKSKLVARKTFVYHSIIHGLKRLACSDGFLRRCEHWRSRSSVLPNDMYSDIYEGNVWKSFNSINGTPFLSQPNNLCLMLNVDWFNPYDQTPYSIGVIYFVVQNLPRNQRFKMENVILAGLIPGPEEPKKDINSYLSPIIDDLEKLYQGITFYNPASYTGVSSIRAILTCVSCDLPATRKVCGFYNFNALKGCSKCLKSFPTEGFGSKPDYSGYDVTNWQRRDYEAQLRIVNSAKVAPTARAQTTLEQSYGARYTELTRLAYFDVVHYHVIDPMHNLFLGIAKHTLCVWKELNIITDKKLEAIQDRVDNMNPPPQIGRIPRKIKSGFFSFTADEWKNWIIMYSPFALFNLVQLEHYECWCHFVEACQLICHPNIRKEMIERAHILLVKFCTSFEQLYGKEKCTPNMHMACHLKDTIYDYGSVYGIWCFSFERYNGILENMKKSWVCPEKQLMFKFLNLQYIYLSTNSSDSSKDFTSLIHTGIESLRGSVSISGSLTEMAVEELDILEQTKAVSGRVSNIDAMEKPFHKIIQPLYEKCFTDPEMELLSQVYSALYPSINFIHISRVYKQFKTLLINGEEFISISSRSARSAAIIAYWSSPIGRIDVMGMGEPKIGIIQYFIRHKIKINDTCTTSLFARVKWFEEHPERNHFNQSIIVCGRLFCAELSASFIPVSRIMGRCTITQTEFEFDYGTDSITVAVPRNLRSIASFVGL